jgi:hypothetical protein
VKGFRQGEHHDLEVELRRYRPEPPPDVLAAIVRNRQERLSRPRIVRRAAVVGALTVVMAAMFAAVGGIGYASSAANSAFQVSKLERLVGISHKSHSAKLNHVRSGTRRGALTGTVNNPVFGDEYRPGKGCGDRNHIHTRSNECTGNRQP